MALSHWRDLISGVSYRELSKAVRQESLGKEDEMI
jgi:hypothetical protein